MGWIIGLAPRSWKLVKRSVLATCPKTQKPRPDRPREKRPIEVLWRLGTQRDTEAAVHMGC